VRARVQRSAGRRPPPAPRRVVSLERALSKLGIASRVEARRCIETGRVRVGDRVVRDPRWRVDPDLDRIAVDGVPARRATAVYLVLHKPVGVVTTRRDPEGRRTVYDLLPADAPHLGAVGRLDLDSSGLLLFTNDTRLAARLTDPLTHVTKVYDVRLDAPITAADAARLASGVVLSGRRTRPARIEPNRSARRDARARQDSRRRAADANDAGTEWRVTLVEGRNRQVRRMFESLGRVVLVLHRPQFGPLSLQGLAPGAWRWLGTGEIRALERCAPVA